MDNRDSLFDDLDDALDNDDSQPELGANAFGIDMSDAQDYDDYSQNMGNNDMSMDMESDNYDDYDDGGGGAPDNSGMKKTLILFMLVGLGIFIIGFLGVRIVKSIQNKPKKQETQVVQETLPPQNQQVVTQQPQYTQTTQRSEWQAIDNNSDIQDLSTVTCTFTITNITHEARVVESTDYIELKTVAKGNLSGFPGTYTLELPYDKGTQLSVGNSFDVEVTIGTYSGKTTVCGIEY